MEEGYRNELPVRLRIDDGKGIDVNPLVPGRFSGASLSAEHGELQVRLSDGGNWQLKVKADGEADWRLLCTGNLDGGVFAPPPDDGELPIRLGALRIDLVGRVVDVRGVAVVLTSLEFDLLAALASDPGRLFPKAELLREVWGSDHPSRIRTLDTHASRLRCKLRRAGANGFVLNFRNFGYKLWEGSVVPSPTA
jgi:DNA-binding winged helix-turn-helix (wHTH) protein